MSIPRPRRRPRQDERIGADLFRGPSEQIIRAAYDRYRPRSYDGPIALYTSDEYRTRLASSQFGWAKLATGGIDVVDLPTDHFGMLRPDTVRRFSDDLRKRIVAIRSTGQRIIRKPPAASRPANSTRQKSSAPPEAE